jgi:oligopeptidase B
MTPLSPDLRVFLDDILTGRLSRREVMQRSLALGLSLPTLAALLRRQATAQEATTAPDAQAQPRLSALPGAVMVDPYAWLEDPEDPEVVAYLEAENAYTDAVMASTKDLEETLYREMIGRIKQTDTSLPFSWNGYLYYTRVEEGKDYPILCRKKGNMEAAEEILVDLNAVAGEYLGLGYWIPSPDNRYLAYELDTTGQELFTIHVLDMESGQETDALPESTSFEWGNDSRTIFYCKQDVAQGTYRPYALHRHTLGDVPAADPLMYQEDDERF